MSVELTDNNNKIKVTYSDGNTVFIKPVPFSKLEVVISYQELILNEIMKNNFYVSSTFYKDSPIVNSIKSIIKVLPVLSDKDNDRLSIDRLESLDDLIKLFITKEVNRHEHTGQLIPDKQYETYLPSMLSIIHGIDFFTMREQIRLKLIEEEKQKNG